jgi:hypothetical protein
MKSRLLPQSTPYDRTEDSPGSVDPLGTVTGAEQLAEVLLPGLTARMWRVRLLTYAALAAAVVRQEESGPSWRKASRRLPGIGLARQAWRAGDQPLERANFLKGQGVNGPFGVISRLARDIGIVDEAGELQRAGTELLIAWAEDQNLSGLLDETAGRAGADWLRRLVRQVSSYLDDGHNWPKKNWAGWLDLADRLRPDQPGPRERNFIKKLLSYDPLLLRDRVIGMLAEPDFVAIYQAANAKSSRSGIEKEVIEHGFVGISTEDEVGRTLQTSIKLIDAYESLSGLLESVFRGLLWGLTRNNGQASREAVVGDPTLRPFLAKAHSKIGPAVARFQQSLQSFEMDTLACKRGSVDIDRMHKLLDDSMAASRGDDDCVSAIMDRHVRVQKEKKKGVWIEEDKQWTLMPGFGDTADEPLWYDWYLHPYRITNIYGMLTDLRIVPEVGTSDGEEEFE